jgi:hypothetical protein
MIDSLCNGRQVGGKSTMALWNRWFGSPTDPDVLWAVEATLEEYVMEEFVPIYTRLREDYKAASAMKFLTPDSKEVPHSSFAATLREACSRKEYWTKVLAAIEHRLDVDFIPEVRKLGAARLAAAAKVKLYMERTRPEDPKLDRAVDKYSNSVYQPERLAELILKCICASPVRRCSKCRKTLVRLDMSRGAPMVGGKVQDLYDGVVCGTCRRLECTACKGTPADAPCRFCSAPVSPAFGNLPFVAPD